MGDESTDINVVVARLEAHTKHMVNTVDDLAVTMKEHAAKTSQDIKDLHVKIETGKKEDEEKYVVQKTHDAEMKAVKWGLRTIATSLGGLATGAIAYLLYGKGG